MVKGMTRPRSISRIRRLVVGSNCPPKEMTLVLVLLLLSLAGLNRPVAAMSRIEGAAANLTASTYSVAASSASSMQQQQRSGRRKRSLVFPTGSDLSFSVGLSIPIAALSATSEFPIDGLQWPSQIVLQRAVTPVMLATCTTAAILLL